VPYGVKFKHEGRRTIGKILSIAPKRTYTSVVYFDDAINHPKECDMDDIKPYLFPMSSMTDEDYAIYSKIWEDTGKTAYLDGCHHLISTIKAYKAANDYLISKHYDINGLIPMGLANDATGKNIY
jgi:hypothetical protein